MEEKNKGQQLEVISYLSKGNHFVLYVFRKVSKVSEAIYLVTDIIKDAEPLKWTLRKVASEAASLKYFLDEHSVFNTIERMLLEIEGLLDFAERGRVISEMNVMILQEEIRKLILEMKESRNGAYGSQLSSPFFDIPKPSELLPERSLSNNAFTKNDQYKSHKGHNVLYDFYTPKPANIKNSPSKLDTNDKGQRREKIIAVVRTRGNVTIKDILGEVKDCSEKTIQRELIQLVLEGVLKKTGERRWSRYSINSH